jgi:hypothetical protein
LGGLNLDLGGILREQEAIFDKLLGILNNLARIAAMIRVELLQQILAEGHRACARSGCRQHPSRIR